jgi:outer membrane receptor protein involved in Fe transport
LGALCAALTLHAQDAGRGVISGTLTESWEGRPLAGATVTVRGTTLAVTTDARGRFQLTGVPPGVYTLQFSAPGYTRAVLADVLVAPGQTSPVTFSLRPEFYELEEYVVTAPELESGTEQLLAERREAAALLDSMGAERFARVGASDAADIVSRVPGVTVSEGKTPVVRGLNERYVGVTLNGAEVPSPDPYKKTVNLDLFPAGLIQSVTVQKSFTPEQPGNFTGGGINIVTRSFPEAFTLQVSGEAGYNTQATGSGRFLSYRGGSLDWLGMDDGTRALPGALAARDAGVPFAPFSTGRPTSPTYAQRKADAERLAELTRQLGTTEFQGRPAAPPPNHKFAFALGDTASLGGRRLGYFVGLPYDRRFSHYDDGVARRYAPGVGENEFVVRKDFRDLRSLEEVTWAGLVNLAYELSEDHELGFNYLHTQSAEDLVRRQLGTIADDPGTAFDLNRLIFTERVLDTWQLRGRHELPALADLRVDWLGSLATTTQDEPDARFFNFGWESGRPVLDRSGFPEPRAPTRYFRELAEDNANAKVDLTLPLTWWSKPETRLRGGFYVSDSQRDFVDREIYYQGQSGETARYPFTGDPNSYLTPENLGYRAATNATTGVITYAWDRYLQLRRSRYDGQQQILAGYLMAEVPLHARWKVIGGARYETTDLTVASESYLANSITGLTTNRSELAQVDWLPAAGLIWTPRTNLAVRFNYAQTLARPTFRELAAYRGYDPILDELLDGNPRLRMSAIDNYDLRWEWFPRPGEVVAVSLFYKDLRDAIERNFVTRDAEIVSFSNREKAETYGVEFEARKGLDFIPEELGRLSLGLNLALIQSEVALTPEELAAKREVIPDARATRSLYDQSPYILNADLNYDLPATGTSLTLVFNVFGPRIAIASLTTEDVFEQPAPVLDLVVRQRLGQKLSLKFSAKNLLDPAVERTYGESGARLYSSHTRGITLALGLSYEF